MTTKLRAVLALRISDLKDNSTSITRQRTATATMAEARGMEVVGEACDEDVSASKVAPADRPELGAWMKRPDEFDAFIFWRQDRAVRSMADMADLCRWAKENKKRLLFTEGGVNEVNLADPTSEFMVMAFAFAAQMEAQAISDRVNSWYRHSRATERSTGGAAPFGYRTVDLAGGGVGYEVDPETSALVQEAAKSVLSGDSLNSIAQDWQARGIPTNLDRARIAKGREVRQAAWTGSMVGIILRSEGILGRKMEARRDESGKKIGMKPVLIKGKYVKVAEPILSEAEWSEVNSVLDARSQKRARSEKASALLGVIFCITCGAPLYRDIRRKKNKNGTVREYRYYCCKGKKGAKPCPKTAYRADGIGGAESVAYALFLSKLSGVEVYRQRYVPGEDHASELESVKKRIRAMRSDRANGIYDGPEDEVEYQEDMRYLIAERNRLESLPSVPAQYVSVPTGETFGELWKRLDTEQRRRLMVEAGARFTYGQAKFVQRDILGGGVLKEGPLLGIELPDDLAARAQEWAQRAEGAAVEVNLGDQ